MKRISKRALGPLLLGLGLLAPGRADAQVLQALAGVARAGVPLAMNIVSQIPGAGAAMPALAGANSIVNGNIAGGINQIVGSYTNQQVNIPPAATAAFQNSIQNLGTAIQNAPPLLPGPAVADEVEQLKDQVEDLTDVVEDLKDELAEEREGDEDEADSTKGEDESDAADPEDGDSEAADEAVGDAEAGDEEGLPDEDQTE